MSGRGAPKCKNKKAPPKTNAKRKAEVADAGSNKKVGQPSAAAASSSNSGPSPCSSSTHSNPAREPAEFGKLELVQIEIGPRDSNLPNTLVRSRGAVYPDEATRQAFESFRFYEIPEEQKQKTGVVVKDPLIVTRSPGCSSTCWKDKNFESSKMTRKRKQVEKPSSRSCYSRKRTATPENRQLPSVRQRKGDGSSSATGKDLLFSGCSQRDKSHDTQKSYDDIKGPPPQPNVAIDSAGPCSDSQQVPLTRFPTDGLFSDGDVIVVADTTGSIHGNQLVPTVAAPAANSVAASMAASTAAPVVTAAPPAPAAAAATSTAPATSTASSVAKYTKEQAGFDFLASSTSSAPITTESDTVIESMGVRYPDEETKKAFESLNFRNVDREKQDKVGMWNIIRYYDHPSEVIRNCAFYDFMIRKLEGQQGEKVPKICQALCGSTAHMDVLCGHETLCRSCQGRHGCRVCRRVKSFNEERLDELHEDNKKNCAEWDNGSIILVHTRFIVRTEEQARIILARKHKRWGSVTICNILALNGILLPAGVDLDDRGEVILFFECVILSRTERKCYSCGINPRCVIHYCKHHKICYDCAEKSMCTTCPEEKRCRVGRRGYLVAEHAVLHGVPSMQ